MILEGLSIAYEMDLYDGLTDMNRSDLFQSFVNGYINHRPLSEKEKLVFNDIYSISKGLWFTKILHNEFSLEKLIEANEQDKVTKLLKNIYHDMTCDTCIL